MLRRSKDPLVELIPIRARLSDLNKRAMAGDKTCYGEMVELLKMLYGPNNSKSLLDKTMDAIGFDVLVAIHYSVEEEAELGLLPAELAGHLHPNDTSNVANWFTCGHIIIDISDALDRKDVTINGREFGCIQIIEKTAQNLKEFNSIVGAGDLPEDSERAVTSILIDMAGTSVQLIDLIEDKIENNSHSTHFRKRK